MSNRFASASAVAIIAALSSAAIVAVAGPACAQERARQFDIPAQPLSSALMVYSRQSDIPVVASMDLLKGKQAPAVRGSMTPSSALDRLLAGSGLKSQRQADGGLVLRRGETGPFVQGENERAAEIDEVVVTATKRPQSLMSVPVSITAMTAEDIAKVGAKNLEDLTRTVPGMVVQQQSEQDDKAYIIRGIGSASRSATVAVYVDDTPITFGYQMPDLKLFDVSQIEVLRGPQGTLFGSSSMGGAIRYVSPKPSFSSFSGSLKGELSSTADGGVSYETQAAAGGPLVDDKVAFRASAFVRRDAGYIDLLDEDTGLLVQKDINSAQSYGGRMALTAQLGDGLDGTLSLIFQEQNTNGPNTFYSGRGVTDPVPLPPLSRVNRVDPFRDDRIFLPNLTLNAELPFAKLTSSTSFVDRRVEQAADFSFFVQSALGVPDPYGRALIAKDSESRTFRGFVEEVRLVSSGEGPLSWIAGAFYQKTSEPSTQQIISNLGDLIPELAPLILPGDLAFDQTSTTDREQKAIFGEASYTAFSSLKVTGGLRLTELSVRSQRTADGLFNGGYQTYDLTSKERPVTPKFSVQYTRSPDLMFYATAAKGFREGGPNAPVPTGIPACAAALEALGRTSAPESYKTDTLWSYELGVKARTSDRRLQLNGAIYHVDWNGIQQSIGLAGGCGFSYIDNIGKATSQGFELETSWRATENLRLDLALGYTDAKLAEDLVTGADASGPVVLARRGTRLPDVAAFTASTSAEYQFPAIAGWVPTARAEYDYIGNAPRDFGEDVRNGDRASYSLVNLRVMAAKGPYEFDLFVDNLFDNGTRLFQSYGYFAPGPAYAATRVHPRVIGMSLSRTF